VFDRVYLINLESRPDRLEAFRERQKLRGWKLPDPIVYPAIHGDTVGAPKRFTEGGGAHGCRQSHVRILEDCLMDGVESVLVMEDDAEWFDEVWLRLESFLKVVPADWDCLMLGGWHERPSTPVGPGVCRAVKVGGTHAYAVRGRAMKSLLALWYDCTVHIDWAMSDHWQKKWNTYCPTPFLFGQGAGRSDISGRSRLQPQFGGPAAPIAAVPGDRVYSHAGDCGDLIAALPVLAARPGALRLVQHACTGKRMTRDRVESLRPLLEAQSYVRGVEWADAYDGERLDKGIRQYYQPHLNIADMQCDAFHVAHWPRGKPWLRVPEVRKVARVALARSARYHTAAFPWKEVLAKYGSEAVFLGTVQEHAAFCAEVGPVPYHPTADFLALAEVIAGAELVAVNQTAIFWLAEGLKKPVLLEVFPPADNCNFARPAHVHGLSEGALPEIEDLAAANVATPPAVVRTGRRVIGGAP
jgi:GR25 family glycosyltransferase involved in LPS biosynthesis